MCDKKSSPMNMVTGIKKPEGSSWLGNLTGDEEEGGGGEQEKKEDSQTSTNKYQEVSHPPVTGKLTDLSESYDKDMRNRFLNELYLKYPSLLPKEIPRDQFYEFNVNVKYSGQQTGITTYRADYGLLKPEETPDLYRAAGLHKRPPPKKPYRTPGTPYLNGERNPISGIKEPSHKKSQDVTIEDMVPASAADAPTRNLSEYDDNYNGLVRYFKKKKIYSEPFVIVSTKPTIPKLT